MKTNSEELTRRLKAMETLGRMGAEQAVEGLSTLIGQRISISIPSVSVVPLGALTIVGSESRVSLTYIEGISENIRGTMVIVFPHEDSVHLLELISNRPAEPEYWNDSYSVSIFKEVCNIMCGCYLNTVSVVLGNVLTQSLPQFHHGTLKSALEAMSTDTIDVESDAVLFETQFLLREGGCRGLLLFLPSSSSIEQMFNTVSA